MKIIFSIFYLVITSSLALYSPDTHVIELTASNFDKKVLESDSVWLVEFYAPWCGHCQKLVLEYQKAAKALRGIAKVGAVNVDEQTTLGTKFNIQGFPTIKIFGADKQYPEKISGDRSAKSFTEAVIKEIKKKVEQALKNRSDVTNRKVTNLDDSNFESMVKGSKEPWLVMFYAPSCQHCQKFTPEFKSLAIEFKPKINFGLLDSIKNKEKAETYKINRYPTVKLFIGNKILDYSGLKMIEDLKKWILEELENAKAPEIIQITENTFNNDFPISVISVLPNILDCQSNCRNSYLGILKSLGKKYQEKLWNWFWCEAGTQPKLEFAVDIGGFGYPAMAVINSKKMKFSLFKGSFSEDGIDSFLKGIAYGKGDSMSLKGEKLPEIIESEIWDGKDKEFPNEIPESDVVFEVKDEL